MRFPIVKHFKYFMGLTLLVLFIGVISIFTRGFNMGIDFTGGSIVDLTFENEVTVSQVRDVLSQHGMGNSIIQLENSTNNEKSKSVLIRTGLVEDDQLRAAVSDMQGALGNYQINRMENIGATIGEELIEQAAMAVVLSWLLMIVYITYRFEFNFAVAAVAALVIDVFVTISYFSFFQMELDSSFVAALLTVVGFSINGTVVIFDRIRENLKLHRRSEGLEELVETSIWQCMTRTVYTESTALFSFMAAQPFITLCLQCWLALQAAVILPFALQARCGLKCVSAKTINPQRQTKLKFTLKQKSPVL